MVSWEPQEITKEKPTNVGGSALEQQARLEKFLW